jgi:hypothetical protein
MFEMVVLPKATLSVGAILGGDYSTIPGPDYRYFLLHKLIGDIVWIAGAAECLGLDALERDDDPWDGTHIVALSPSRY